MRSKFALILIGFLAVVAFCVVYSLNVNAARNVRSGCYAHPGIGNGTAHSKVHSRGNGIHLAGLGSSGGYGKSQAKSNSDSATGPGSGGGYQKSHTKNSTDSDTGAGSGGGYGNTR